MLMEDAMKDEQNVASNGVDRRNLMKLSAGALITTLSSKGLFAEPPQEKSRSSNDSGRATDVVEVGSGYKNEANRASGNGPMDETTKKLVSFVHSFSESQLTDSINAAVSKVMIDSIASLISGFEAEPVRIAARIAKMNHCDMKSTVFGYGVSSSPELAAFANSCMIRHTDFNDMEPPSGSHSSVMLPGILAVGEALHSTGLQIMVATVVGYEILWSVGRSAKRKVQLDGPYEGMATALACGKLMGLNEDKLANALSLAIVPHLPMFVSHAGALSHWKGCHSGMGVREGVFAAIMAREGMTGPAQPFEGRGGLWDTVTGSFDLKIPYTEGRLLIEDMGFKRFPAEGSTQGILDQFIPQLRTWAKPEEIESIRVEVPFSTSQEVGDPPKWDPRNRETADHSYAYVLSIGMIDGDVYLQSFKPERYLADNRVRALMSKVTIRPNPEFKDLRKRITVRKKSGEVMVKDLYDVRPMSHDDIVAKFNRICTYMHISDEQRDRALSQWSNLRTIRDIAEPISNLARFGKPTPL